jgi:hypothetical protein
MKVALQETGLRSSRKSNGLPRSNSCDRLNPADLRNNSGQIEFSYHCEGVRLGVPISGASSKLGEWMEEYFEFLQS